MNLRRVLIGKKKKKNNINNFVVKNVKHKCTAKVYRMHACSTLIVSSCVTICTNYCKQANKTHKRTAKK